MNRGRRRTVELVDFYFMVQFCPPGARLLREKITEVMSSLSIDEDYLHGSDSVAQQARLFEEMNRMIISEKRLFDGSVSVAKHLLTQIDADLDIIDDKKMRVFKKVDVTIEGGFVTMEYISTLDYDMYVVPVMEALIKAEMMARPAPTMMDRRENFKLRLIDDLRSTFGEDCVPKINQVDKFDVTVGNKMVHVDISKLEITDEDDNLFEQNFKAIVSKLGITTYDDLEKQRLRNIQLNPKFRYI
ncbi:hypothetical protein PV326_000433 [Microctonus aethiopoides]|nr:hypothetical protein PV326_000433 [Microctonus aethiopoides]